MEILKNAKAPGIRRGLRFSRLKVLGRIARDDRRKKYVECLCDCGTVRFIDYYRLKAGVAVSCGCAVRSHGMSRTGVYRVWKAMRQRCQKTYSKGFYNYGARGIKVCKRWEKFENFLSDMGERPLGLTLERKNNSKGYFPKNCRWATVKEQCRNTRVNRILSLDGRRMPMIEWAELVGMRYKTLTSRIYSGLSLREALTRSLRHDPHSQSFAIPSAELGR